VIGAAIEVHVAEEHRMIAGLSREERGVLKSLLSKLLISLEPVTASVAPIRDKRASARRGGSRRRVP
jgi:hypothetical protein